MHTLTVGRTGSGKTTMWKLKAGLLVELGCPVLVYDPVGNGIPARRTFDDVAELVNAAKEFHYAHLIIDESGTGLGKYPGELQWLTTQARNWGHSTHLICQRAEQVNKTVRLQCEGVYLFRASEEDAANLARDFTQPKLGSATGLGQYQFLYARTFGEVQQWMTYPKKLVRMRNP